MTAALVSLAVVVAGLGAALVWQSKRAGDALNGQIVAAKALVDMQRLRDEEHVSAESYIAQRDAKVVELAAALSLNNALKMRIASLEADRNRAYDQAVQDVKERIRSGSSADAAAVIDRLLGAPLPGVSTAAQTGASGGRGQGQGTL